MCRAHALGIAESLPLKEKKKPRPTRHAVAFWLQSRDGGHVLMRRRPEKGLLGGMLELPSTPWRESGPWSDEAAQVHLPMARLNWRKAEGQATHTFTHFHLIADVWCAETDADLSALGIAQPIEALGDAAIPTVIAKMIRLARQH
jgi:A/G-specific adenine glycosylase